MAEYLIFTVVIIRHYPAESKLRKKKVLSNDSTFCEYYMGLAG